MVLLDFDLFMVNVNDLKNHFNPTYFTDCELYLEKLIKIKDKLKKGELKRQKWHKKLYGYLCDIDFLVEFYGPFNFSGFIFF